MFRTCVVVALNLFANHVTSWSYCAVVTTGDSAGSPSHSTACAPYCAFALTAVSVASATFTSTISRLGLGGMFTDGCAVTSGHQSPLTGDTSANTAGTLMTRSVCGSVVCVQRVTMAARVIASP